MKFAVVGSGVSGLSIATILSQDHEVVLYEKDNRFGGHSNTIEINYKNEIVNVDTGFIVFNKLNYPNLIKFFKYFNVMYEDSDMSLSIQHENLNIEWSGQNIKSIFSKKTFTKKFLTIIVHLKIAQLILYKQHLTMFKRVKFFLEIRE